MPPPPLRLMPLTRAGWEDNINLRLHPKHWLLHYSSSRGKTEAATGEWLRREESS